MTILCFRAIWNALAKSVRADTTNSSFTCSRNLLYITIIMVVVFTEKPRFDHLMTPSPKMLRWYTVSKKEREMGMTQCEVLSSK